MSAADFERRLTAHGFRSAFTAGEASAAQRIWQGGRTEAQAAVIGELAGLVYRHADEVEAYRAEVAAAWRRRERERVDAIVREVLS